MFTDNLSHDNGASAFRIGGARNTISGNAGNGSRIGFEDFSVPGVNEYTDNTCLTNRDGGSSPPGLCDDTVPVEPEPSPQPSESPVADEAPTTEE